MIENGDVLELDADRATSHREARCRAHLSSTIRASRRSSSETVRERKQMAYDGVLTPI
jgi:mRNA degradation ribonuclease J1/J2